MNTRLGRGLGALIPSNPAPGTSTTLGSKSHSIPGAPPIATPSAPELAAVPGAEFAEIDVDKITPNPKQPRSVFDEDAMEELVHSVKEIGLLQPIVVRRLEKDKYELVMGERRWRATQQAGLTTIPAIVRDTQDDVMLRDALLENLHRSQLNPLEEAAAYQQMLDDFGCTQEVLATRIGRSRPQISNTLRLLSSVGSRPASCPPVMPALCSACRAATRSSDWPSGSLPRASRCARSKRSLPWAT